VFINHIGIFRLKAAAL